LRNHLVFEVEIVLLYTLIQGLRDVGRGTPTKC